MGGKLQSDINLIASEKVSREKAKSVGMKRNKKKTLPTIRKRCGRKGSTWLQKRKHEKWNVSQQMGSFHNHLGHQNIINSQQM